MKAKILKIVLPFCIVSSMLVACGSSNNQTTTTTEPTSLEESPTEKTIDNTFLYENKDLNISFELPKVIEDKVSFEIENDDDINTLYINYGEGDKMAILAMIQDMSIAKWEEILKEDGPKPVELGKNDKRVVVIYPLQSNPFEQGTNEYDIINKYTEQVSCIADTFKFLN